MLKGSTFLPSIALAAAMLFPVAAQAAPDADTVVARVNGEEITVGHMIIAYASLPEQYRQMPVDLLYKGILEQLIQQSALGQSRTGEIPKIITLQLENERRSLLAADAIEDVMGSAASEDEIAAAYQTEYGEGEAGTEYNASHILVETEDEAKGLAAELEGGADFAELAKQKSTGPSGPNGGELGWFGEGMMVPEFEVAVKELAVGQVSQPIQTQFGWHVIKLNDSRIAKAPELNEVHDEIAERLRQEAVEARVAALVEKATVETPEIDGLEPEILQDLGLVIGD